MHFTYNMHDLHRISTPAHLYIPKEFNHCGTQNHIEKYCLSKFPSSIAPVNHGPELLIPQAPVTHVVSSTSSEDDDVDFGIDDRCSSKDPHFPNQNELDDLV